MKDYQERVVVEKAELDKKINQLSSFVVTTLYNELEGMERIRLINQLDAMHTYSNVLNERINSFRGE